MRRASIHPKPITNSRIGKVRFDWMKSLWFWSMLAISLIFGLPHLTRIEIVLASALGVLTFCLGHSVGLHRGIIHSTYQTSIWLRGFLAYLFVLTGLGGPITWARLHAIRDYWQNQMDCPPYFAYRHSLWRDFWWNLHLRFAPRDDRAMGRIPADILSDPWLRFLEATWPLHQLPVAAFVWFWLGPTAVASVVCGRIAVGILCHWFIGYASHAWGHSPYKVPGASEYGTNHWFLGVLSFGEGFHNNHHAFPRSARMGQNWWDLDLGWLAIRGFQRLGLVWGIQQVDDGKTCLPAYQKSRSLSTGFNHEAHGV